MGTMPEVTRGRGGGLLKKKIIGISSMNSVRIRICMVKNPIIKPKIYSLWKLDLENSLQRFLNATWLLVQERKKRKFNLTNKSRRKTSDIIVKYRESRVESNQMKCIVFAVYTWLDSKLIQRVGWLSTWGNKQQWEVVVIFNSATCNEDQYTQTNSVRMLSLICCEVHYHGYLW